MSGGGNPLYKIAAQDSRNMARLGNALGWQGLEDEANHNVKNPGRAITKAAINAALWYVGSAAGNYLGGAEGAAAGSGAGAAAGTGGTTLGTTADALAASQAFGNLSSATTEQLMKQAIQNAAEQGVTSGTKSALGSSLLRSMDNPMFANATKAAVSRGGLLANAAGPSGTMESALTDTGYTPSSLLNAARYGPQSGQSMGQTLANYGSNQALGIKQGFQAFKNDPAGYLKMMGSSEGGGGKASDLALQMGLKSLEPQQPQGLMPAPPRQQQDTTPLPMPYQNSLMSGNNSLSNSMPPPGMSYAEWIRRKQLGLI